MTNPNADLVGAVPIDPDRRSPVRTAPTSVSILRAPRQTGLDDRSDTVAGEQPTLKRQHPALVRHAEERARKLQNRIADAITSYAGSMRFVYIHIALFAGWMIWFEKSPWPTLTLVVSLEAIFLSTFVMISQNRADQKRAALASQAWQSVQLEEKQNEELLQLSQQILGLTDEIHKLTVVQAGGMPSTAQAPASPERINEGPRPEPRAGDS
jgi:uncharacterized membrane protein